MGIPEFRVVIVRTVCVRNQTGKEWASSAEMTLLPPTRGQHMRPFRSTLVVALALLPAACGEASPTAAPAAAAPLLAARGTPIPGAYLVVLRDGAPADAVARALGISPTLRFAHALNGFAARLSAAQLNALRQHPDVAFVEEDQLYRAETTQSSAPWGLDRIDQRNLPLSGTYTYTSTGAGVRAYIVDTGLQADHPQFGTRAQNVYDYAGGSGADCNGHGTHVAGIVGAQTYGVAKGVYLRGVRVLDCNGSGSTSAVVAGIDWVRANAVKPAVANLSIGGPVSSTLNTAVTNLSNAGIFVSVAAGNENQDACNTSPASAVAAFATAATNSDDTRRSSGNYGSCVDAYAPGTNIVSTWIGSGTATLSGSSMAAPHVAGVAALYKATFGDAASATIDSWIKTNATAGVVKNVPAGTPNRLLYKAAL
jgi:subtilisin family serine protease